MASDSDSEMSFWAHLDALRSTIMKIAGLLLVLAIGFFAVMPWVFDNVICAPCSGDFILYHLFAGLDGDGSLLPDLGDPSFHIDLINIELASQFMIHMSSSLWAAFIVGFPIVVYLLWQFVAPGLYEKEKHGARMAFLFGNVMFYLGMAVGYFLVFPLAVRFLADYQLSSAIVQTVSLTSYMDAFYTLVLSMGIVFELPLVAWLLGKIGILRRGFFTTYRRHAIVVLLVTAAIITPTGDIMTLAIVFLPIYALWEASALLVPKSKPEQETDDGGDTD